MITPQAQKDALSRLLDKLRKADFWGKVVLQIRKGDVVMASVEQTAPFSELAENDCAIVVLEKANGKVS